MLMDGGIDVNFHLENKVQQDTIMMGGGLANFTIIKRLKLALLQLI